MPETEEERKAREAVNNSIINTPANDMRRVVDAGRSSQKKRDDLQSQREKRERERRERFVI